MNETEKVIFDELDEFLTEIAAYKKKLYPNMNQRAYFIRQLLNGTIAGYQLDRDKQKGSENLDKLVRRMADKRSEISRDLIPMLEEIGDQRRLELAVEFVEAFDHFESLILDKVSFWPAKIL